ncbi:MAG: ZIP family metal transporter [Bacteroidales bacterium]|jgi:zinc and cadmium transporter
MGITYLLVALFLGSVGSVAFAGLMLILDDEKLNRLSTHLMYLAGGTLLGAAFLGMIPKAISMSEPNTILRTILFGILFFFILEKIILWRSCHNETCERQMNAAAPIIIIGDAFHNAIDGIVIAASFLTSTELGVFVTFSVVLHEIPQELGDFGILIKSGYPRVKAFWYNILSGATAIVFGLAAYYTLESITSWIPYVLALSASSFLYIALADLIPEMHRKTTFEDSVNQILLIALGIFIIYMSLLLK